jgi:hypothetical protein
VRARARRAGRGPKTVAARPAPDRSRTVVNPPAKEATPPPRATGPVNGNPRPPSGEMSAALPTGGVNAPN